MGVMIVRTLHRYFALRFLSSAAAVLAFMFAIIVMLDYVEMMRRTADLPAASALLVAKVSFFRVPQVTERILPFAVLVAAMASFLAMSRRLELVIARAAGVSAWQFVAPAVITALLLGFLATAAYNPLAAALQEQSKRLEAELFGENRTGLETSAGGGFWVLQRSEDGRSIMNATSSQQQGLVLGGVSVFQFDQSGRFKQRVGAKTAMLENGHWRLRDARIYQVDKPPVVAGEYLVKTNLTAQQVSESFSTPETVPFWSLPTYIDRANKAGVSAAGYRLQYQKLLAQPFQLASMVLLAAAVSLRFFRFGGVPKMVMSGILGGFFLYVMSKVMDDMAKADLVHPMISAWMPVVLASLTGLLTLLYQEDG